MQLLGDRLSDQRCVELRALDLKNVDLDRLAGDLVQVTAQRINLNAGLADHDAGARGVDVDLNLVRVLADRDLRNAGVGQLIFDVRADRDVFGQVLSKVAFAEPVRLPIVDVADAHRLGVNLLSHSPQLLLWRQRD